MQNECHSGGFRPYYVSFITMFEWPVNSITMQVIGSSPWVSSGDRVVVASARANLSIQLYQYLKDVSL
jgi:hypothetical protein